MVRAGRALVLFACAAACGCASLIGASFDDATLADGAAPDAGPVEASFEDGGPTTPTAVPGLAAWFTADRGVYTTQTGQGPVTQWVDQTLDKHVGTAPSGPQQPTLVPGVQAGKPVVRFDSSQAQVLQVNWAGPGAASLTAFVVAKGYPQSILRFEASYGTTPSVIFPYDVNVTSDAGTGFGLFIDQEVNPHMPVDPARFELLETRYGNGEAQTFVDGKLAEQLATKLPAAPDGLTLFLGGIMPPPAAPDTALPYANADVAEIVVYAAYLDDTQRTGIEEYLRARWAL